jgi:hypothetical protein
MITITAQRGALNETEIVDGREMGAVPYHHRCRVLGDVAAA